MLSPILPPLLINVQYMHWPCNRSITLIMFSYDPCTALSCWLINCGPLGFCSACSGCACSCSLCSGPYWSSSDPAATAFLTLVLTSSQYKFLLVCHLVYFI